MIGKNRIGFIENKVEITIPRLEPVENSHLIYVFVSLLCHRIYHNCKWRYLPNLMQKR